MNTKFELNQKDWRRLWHTCLAIAGNSFRYIPDPWTAMQSYTEVGQEDLDFLRCKSESAVEMQSVPSPLSFLSFNLFSKRWHSLPTGGDGTNSWAWSFHAEEHQWKSCQCTNATCVIMHYGPARELNVHFSRCSRLSRFWRKNSRYPPEIQILKKNSLLDWMRFCKQILLSRVKISWEKT